MLPEIFPYVGGMVTFFDELGTLGPLLEIVLSSQALYLSFVNKTYLVLKDESSLGQELCIQIFTIQMVLGTMWEQGKRALGNNYPTKSLLSGLISACQRQLCKEWEGDDGNEHPTTEVVRGALRCIE